MQEGPYSNFAGALGQTLGRNGRMGTLILSQTEGGIARITINRPEALNALNREVLTELIGAIQNVVRDPAARVLIVTGAGEKAFVAGADIKEMEALDPRGAEEFAQLGHQVMNAIHRAEVISIAAINGFALGGGLELALACDFRIASKNAKLGLPETTLGLLPGFGGTQRLARLVGTSRALEIILTADMVSAERALVMGLVNSVSEPADLQSTVDDFATRLIKGKGPNAQRTARWLVYSGIDLPLSAGLEREINSFAELFANPECREGMQAFTEKRKPNF